MGTTSARILWSIPVALTALTVWAIAVLPRPAPVFPMAVVSVLGLVSFVWLACHPWLRCFSFPLWLSYVLFACVEIWRLASAPAQLLGLQNLAYILLMAGTTLAFVSPKRKGRPDAGA